MRLCVRCVRLEVSAAMGRFPGWAKWPIGVLLSPVFAFLLALSVAIFVVMIKEGRVGGEPRRVWHRRGHLLGGSEASRSPCE
jgi:hypothetical protein